MVSKATFTVHTISYQSHLFITTVSPAKHLNRLTADWRESAQRTIASDGGLYRRHLANTIER